MIHFIKCILIISVIGNFIAFPIVVLFFNISIRKASGNQERVLSLSSKKNTTCEWIIGVWVASVITAVIIS